MQLGFRERTGVRLSELAEVCASNRVRCNISGAFPAVPWGSMGDMSDPSALDTCPADIVGFVYRERNYGRPPKWHAAGQRHAKPGTPATETARLPNWTSSDSWSRPESVRKEVCHAGFNSA